MMMDQVPDITSLGAQAGITGAMVVLVTQVIKAVTQWTDRKALLATALVALVFALIAWAATHWSVATELWKILTGWLSSLAAASGLYTLGRRQNGQPPTNTTNQS